MKRAVRNILIKIICYAVIMGIFLIILGFIDGWSAEKVIIQIISFTLGWVAVTVVTTLLDMKNKKEDKEKAKKRKK